MENHESRPRHNHWQSVDESLQTFILPCRLIGFNFEPRKRNFKDDVMYWLNMLIMNSGLLACFSWVYRSIAQGTDITEITYVAPGMVLGIIADFKAIFSFTYEDEIKKMLDELRNLDKNIDVTNLTDEKLRKTKSASVFLNRVIKLLNFLNINMLLVYDLIPIVLMTTNYYQTKKLQLMLPFLDVYPFDPFDLRIYPFVYFHQIWSEASVLLQICAADYLFYTCCTHIRIQFMHLQYQITDLISQDEADLDPRLLQERLKTLIKWHQGLISNASKLEVITSKSTLINFIISSIVICLTGFNVTTTDDVVAIMTFLVFLFMSLIQVFFLCLFGDLLMQSSIDVSDAAYECRWYKAHIFVRKSILLIQTRSQTPCKVTAAGFADVNLRAYMKILSTSWSYFALLKTVYGLQQHKQEV